MKPNSIVTDPTLRHDFLFFFDVEDGNPNGYRTRAICLESIRKQWRGLSPTCA